MSVEAMVQKMIDDLTAALVDAAKHDKGNSAAGTRVRKAMQEAKAAAQAVRVQVQADKKTLDTESTTAIANCSPSDGEHMLNWFIREEAVCNRSPG